jgi:hypothetical protein
LIVPSITVHEVDDFALQQHLLMHRLPASDIHPSALLCSSP